MQHTTHYNLNKPDPNDTYNKTNDNSNMDAIDTQMYNNAQAAAAAQTTASNAQTTANAATTPGAANDTVIGNRTADPTQAPNGLTGALTQFLSWITNRIKAITGTANWYDAPPTTLTAAESHMTNMNNPHNVTAAETGAVPEAVAGVANGVATTDANNKVVQTANDSDMLGGQLAADYLRIDANAPNPQTVANPVTFDGTTIINALLNLIHASGSGFKIQNNSGGTRFWIDNDGGNFLRFSNGGSPGAAGSILLDGVGNINTPGYITQATGQLGSASGTWTPASGTFNVPVGTVISVASVPSGAKNYNVFYKGGNSSLFNAVIGMSDSNGSAWWDQGGWESYVTSPGSTNNWGGTSPQISLCDGSYEGKGYFQINGGYLQFVVISSSAQTYAQNTLGWAVS